MIKYRMKYFIKTFGCQQNKADSERIASSFEARGMSKAKGYDDTNYVVINTCMIRRSAEDRVYGLVRNLDIIKKARKKNDNGLKIIVTGCMVGLAFRDKTGEYLNNLRLRMPQVDEFMPIEEAGFDNIPVRSDRHNAWVPISNGCNNFCTFCIVPFTRGREVSRPFRKIISECRNLKKKGFQSVTLLGQNVNSYGADLILGENNVQVMRDIDKTYFEYPKGDVNETWKLRVGNASVKPVYVKHLGRYRIPTLFPYLLDEVATLGFSKVDFMSSNPWDFTDELIDVIAARQNIARLIHLPLQAGDNKILKKMNRWYTRQDYLLLVNKLRSKIPDIKISTDIIVGFCGESEEQFLNTVSVCKEVGFQKAYVSMYSPRPMTSATKLLKDDVPHHEKRRRWLVLENLINQPHLNKRPFSRLMKREFIMSSS